MSIHDMILHFNTRTVSFRLIVLCLTATATIPICISGVLIGHISGLVREENETHLDNLLDNLISGVDTTPYNVSQVDRMSLNHVNIQDILLYSQSPDYTVQDYLHSSEKTAIIMNSLPVTEDILYTSFYSRSGRFLFDGNSSFHPVTGGSFAEPWIQEYREAIDSRSMFLISPTHAPKGFYGNSKPFMVMRSLKDIITKEVTAYVVVYAGSSEFQSLLFKDLQGISRDIQTGPVLSIRLTNADGIIVASTNKDRYGRAIGDFAQPEHLLLRQSQYPGFMVCMESSPIYPSHALRITLVSVLGILAEMLLVFGLLTITLLRWMLFPFKDLTVNMQLVGRSNFKLRLNESLCRNDDTREVYHGFNHMTGKIDNLITNVYEQQLLLELAQFRSLTYQISLHLLYDTPQTIEAITGVRDTPEMQTIATSLIQIFRYNSRPENFVPLSDELAHLEAYFSIGHIRFRNQITFATDLAPEPFSLPVPKFILQPIVENVVTHAFHRIPDDGSQVTITGEIVSETNLILHVSDNGVDMEPKQVEALSRKLKDADVAPAVQAKEPIGLIDVRQRLISCCGPDYGLTVVSQADVGARVDIRLPYSPHDTH